MITRHVDSRSFDQLALLYDRYSHLTGQRLREYLVDALPPGGQRALDLGCGSGIYTDLVADLYVDVLAVDLSPRMLEIACRARPRANVQYRLRDLAEVTPDRDGQFDLVFSAYVLHHVPDLEASLRQIRSLSAPGGVVILADFADTPRSRRWFRTQAMQSLADDLRHGRRPVREAVETYRLATHPFWLDHQVANQHLRPYEFERRYASVFPGARFSPLHRSRALWWRNPLP